MEKDYFKIYEENQIARLYEETRDTVSDYFVLCEHLKELIKLYKFDEFDAASINSINTIDFDENKMFVDYTVSSHSYYRDYEVSIPIEWLYLLHTDKIKLKQVIKEKIKEDLKEAAQLRQLRLEEERKEKEEKERKEYERLKAKFGE